MVTSKDAAQEAGEHLRTQEAPRLAQEEGGGGREAVQRGHSTCQIKIRGRKEQVGLQEGRSWAESKQRAPEKVGRSWLTWGHGSLGSHGRSWAGEG